MNFGCSARIGSDFSNCHCYADTIDPAKTFWRCFSPCDCTYCSSSSSSSSSSGATSSSSSSSGTCRPVQWATSLHTTSPWLAFSSQYDTATNVIDRPNCNNPCNPSYPNPSYCAWIPTVLDNPAYIDVDFPPSLATGVEIKEAFNLSPIIEVTLYDAGDNIIRTLTSPSDFTDSSNCTNPGVSTTLLITFPQTTVPV